MFAFSDSMKITERAAKIWSAIIPPSTTALTQVVENSKGLVINKLDSFRVMLPGTQYNYQSQVGNPMLNSAVAACALWIARTFPEAPLQVGKMNDSGDYDTIPLHPMTRLIHRPNKHYSGRLLWMPTLIDYTIGNAYWLKVRNRLGQVVELWYVPASLIYPYSDPSTTEYIDHYCYFPYGSGSPLSNTSMVELPVSEVIHFRNGLDPENPIMGLSQLGSVLREIYRDNEASNFGAALLRNMGVPGVIIAPESSDVDFEPENATVIKDAYRKSFTGDHRGEPMIMGAGLKVIPLSFSPDQMNLKDLHRVPEERVSAVLGIPAIVAGLGAGLDRSTFANMGEAREMAYENNIIPTQSLMAEELDTQLLPDFEKTPMLYRTSFDTSKIRVLQEDVNKAAIRLDMGYKNGWAKRSEVRQAAGLSTSPDDDFYIYEIEKSTSLPDVAPPTDITTLPTDSSALGDTQNVA